MVRAEELGSSAIGRILKLKSVHRCSLGAGDEPWVRWVASQRSFRHPPSLQGALFTEAGEGLNLSREPRFALPRCELSVGPCDVLRVQEEK